MNFLTAILIFCALLISACSLDIKLDQLKSLNPELEIDSDVFVGQIASSKALKGSLPFGFSTATSASLQDSSGRIIAVGEMHKRRALWCFTAAAEYCTNFGVNGVVDLPPRSGGSVFDISMSFDNSGRILVAVISSSGADHFLDIFRFSAHGVLDLSFSDEGKFASFKNSPFYPRGFAFDQGGNIFLLMDVGVDTGTYKYHPEILKLNATGLVDVSFGTLGYVALPFPVEAGKSYTNTSTAGLAIDLDDNLYVGGSSAGTGSSEENLIYKIDAGGQLVAGFGANGILKFSSGVAGKNYDGLLDIKVKNLKLHVSTSVRSGSGGSMDLVLWRLNLDGTTDNTFSGDGKLVLDSIGGATNEDENGRIQYIDSSNNLLISGITFDPGNGRSTYAGRILANGTVDTSFGNNGFIVRGGDELTELYHRHFLFLNSDSSLMMMFDLTTVMVGSTSYADASFWKITSTGQTDLSFGTNGEKQTYQVQNLEVNLLAGVDKETMTKDAEGNFYIFAGHDGGREGFNSVVLKYNSTGVLQTSFGTDGQLLIANLQNAFIHADGDNLWISGLSYDSVNSVNRLTIQKRNRQGQLISSFGTNGVQTLDSADFEFLPRTALVVRRLNSNQLVLISNLQEANTGDQKYLMWRVSSNTGVPDSTLQVGTYFKVLSVIPTGSQMKFEVINSSELVLAGSAVDSVRSREFNTIYKLNGSGVVVNSFGTSGFFDLSSFDNTSPEVNVTDFAISPENEIFLTGSAFFSGSDTRSFLVKLTALGTPNTDFQAGGYKFVARGLGAEFINNYITTFDFSNDGSIQLGLMSINMNPTLLISQFFVKISKDGLEETLIRKHDNVYSTVGLFISGGAYVALEQSLTMATDELGNPTTTVTFYH